MVSNTEIRLDHFIKTANAAYYANKDPFADFITAPEISQIFGELIAVWMITVIRSMPIYKKIALVEAGPGRGTLMADILRVIHRSAPEIYQICNVFLIETSPRLRQIQKDTLHHHDLAISWLDSIDDLPPLPIVMVANEFLDALPIRQFLYKDYHQWLECYVNEGKAIWKIIKQLPAAPVFNRPLQLGDKVEVCEVGQQIIAQITKHINDYGGTALFIDYGYRSLVWGDTLQAIAKRKKVDPFGPIGEADLTAHVDFVTLKEIAEQYGGIVYGIQTQGDFLKQLGILIRAKLLSDQVSGGQKQEILQAVHRLIDPNEMGNLFKVMAICHSNIPTPPAFEQIKPQEYE